MTAQIIPIGRAASPVSPRSASQAHALRQVRDAASYIQPIDSQWQDWQKTSDRAPLLEQGQSCTCEGQVRRRPARQLQEAADALGAAIAVGTICALCATLIVGALALLALDKSARLLHAGHSLVNKSVDKGAGSNVPDGAQQGTGR